ncbi:hypothetical protein [Sphingosinicella sp. CPCC 101087]|uniref:hypothetical protein n=1 Tax=Sphingosinicella sp. CPCC 101087 TaxID=2497754 RepID=UPI0013ED8A5F|nr:hypothetical protein [Sphingosinicella sp. CPCC 101087]
MPKRETHRVVAIGLLTQGDLDILGAGFRRAIPLEEANQFESLLAAINEAERRSAAR